MKISSLIGCWRILPCYPGLSNERAISVGVTSFETTIFENFDGSDRKAAQNDAWLLRG